MPPPRTATDLLTPPSAWPRYTEPQPRRDLFRTSRATGLTFVAHYDATWRARASALPRRMTMPPGDSRPPADDPNAETVESRSAEVRRRLAKQYGPPAGADPIL